MTGRQPDVPRLFRRRLDANRHCDARPPDSQPPLPRKRAHIDPAGLLDYVHGITDDVTAWLEGVVPAT